MLRYQTRRIQTGHDPLYVVATLADAACDDYVVYEANGRWTFVSGQLARVWIQDGQIFLTRPDGASTAEPVSRSPLPQLGSMLRTLDIHDWRVYGWTAFELAYLAAGLPVGPQVLASFMVPRREVVLTGDHLAEVRAINAAELHDVEQTIQRTRQRAPGHPQRIDSDSPGREEYLAATRTAIGHITDGDLQKVILSRRVRLPSPVDMVATYARGRLANTPGRSFLLQMGSLRAAGFSPETVAEVDGASVVTTPLAGTRALTRDQRESQRLREELIASAKEVYEHAISVKAAFEELRAVCAAGSVAIGEYMTVLERGSVQHLASRVRGRLDPGHDGWDALAALYPAITASGIPKPAAYDLIRRLETHPRGLYAGTVIVADAQGNLDSALALRTIFADGDDTWLQAGAGIVGESSPEREYEETCEKLRCVSAHIVASPATAGTPTPVGE